MQNLKNGNNQVLFQVTQWHEWIKKTSRYDII